MQTYQTQLRRLCCMILKDTHLADDAVQETFIKVYSGMKDFRHESNEKTWLTRIAVNTCRDLLRSRWFRHTDRSVLIDDLPEPEAPSDPEDTGLYETVLRLPVNQREVIQADRAVSVVRFAAEDGSMIELSPFSLRVCPITETDYSIIPVQETESGNEPAIVLSQMDPDSLSELAIEMNDGETFTVLDGGRLDNTM